MRFYFTFRLSISLKNVNFLNLLSSPTKIIHPNHEIIHPNHEEYSYRTISIVNIFLEKDELLRKRKRKRKKIWRMVSISVYEFLTPSFKLVCHMDSCFFSRRRMPAARLLKLDLRLLSLFISWILLLPNLSHFPFPISP